MKAYVRLLEERYDRLGLRERILVVIGVMAVLCYGYAMLFYAPLMAQRQRVAKETEALQLRAQALEEAAAGLGKTAGPAAQRAYRDALRSQIDTLDREMRGMQRTLVTPSEMPALLRSVLSHNRHLSLISLHNAPVERLEPAARAPADAAAPAQRAIYRHTVEIRVAGSYAELHAYLAQLERVPWQMYWGRLEVDAKTWPRLVATLTVHTLSLDKAWLAV